MNAFVADPSTRHAGLLTPLGAIRGSRDTGTGDTESLVELAHWAACKGLRVVQILPVNETCADHSPYNLLSAMAWEPSTLSISPGWLPGMTAAQWTKCLRKHGVEELSAGAVRHAAVKALKSEAFAIAEAAFFKDSGTGGIGEIEAFRTREADWIEDYLVFRSLRTWNGERDVVSDWPEAHRTPATARDWVAMLGDSDRARWEAVTRSHLFVQWTAARQWERVRAEFDRLGLALMGDIPVGVSLYSADVWANPSLFDTSRSSGAPPERVFKSDPFTEKWGQNWGFPLYDWSAMSRDNFAWWRLRLQSARRVFHLLRVDHALGFFRIYSFPWRPEENASFLELSPEEASARTGGRLPAFIPGDDETQESRDRNQRLGEMLFRVLLEETGAHRLVAEDLGQVAPYVRPVLENLEIPGFKIPQWERTEDGRMRAGESYPRLSLSTFATHDHPPIRLFWEDWERECANPETAPAAQAAMQEMMSFCGVDGLALPCAYSAEVHAAFLRGLFATNSWLAIHQITDLFALNDRFNVPGAVGDQNWTVRVPGTIANWDHLFAPELKRLAEALEDSGRS
jgi:4-alpha-glucanotransferase